MKLRRLLYVVWGWLVITGCESNTSGTVNQTDPVAVFSISAGVGFDSLFMSADPLAGLAVVRGLPEGANWHFHPLGGWYGDSGDWRLTLSQLRFLHDQKPAGSLMDRVERIVYQRIAGPRNQAVLERPNPLSLAASQTQDTLWVQLFVPMEIQGISGDPEASLVLATNYPFEGEIDLTWQLPAARSLTLAFRQPGWVDNRPDAAEGVRYRWRTNRKLVCDLEGEYLYPDLARGYAFLTRTWKPGQTLSLSFPMAVRRVINAQSEPATLSLERGPLVLAAGGDPLPAAMPEAGYVVPSGEGPEQQYQLQNSSGEPVLLRPWCQLPPNVATRVQWPRP